MLLYSNPLFAHHDASHDVYQLEIISASEKVSAFLGVFVGHSAMSILCFTTEIMNI